MPAPTMATSQSPLVAVERGRRPMIGLARRDHALQDRFDRQLRAEDRQRRAEDDDGGRDVTGRVHVTAQRQKQKQRAPQRGNARIDDEELRRARAFGIGGARIVGGPRAAQRQRGEGHEALTGEGQPQGVGRDRLGRDEIEERQRGEQDERADLENEDFAAIQTPGFQRGDEREARGDGRAGHAARQQKIEDDERNERKFDGEKSLHRRPRAQKKRRRKPPASSCRVVRSAGPVGPAPAEAAAGRRGARS